MESALVPLKPVSPKKMFNLVMGFFVGAFGALGMAFVMDHLDDSLENPEETENILELPVLASVPELKTPKIKSATSGQFVK
jgi:capsular polysaccharide biosynthesis protein